MSVNTVSKRKDISSDLTEAIFAAHQSGKGRNYIFKQCGVHYFTVKKNTFQWTMFKTDSQPEARREIALELHFRLLFFHFLIRTGVGKTERA